MSKSSTAAKKEEQAVVPAAESGKQVMSPEDIKKQLQQETAEYRDRIGTLPTNQIRTKNKVFTLPNGEANPGPIQVVVLDWIWFYSYFKGAYKAGVKQLPVCFSVHRVEKDKSTGQPIAQPSQRSPEPQSEYCATCPKNEWQDGGGGKPCKNQVRLIVVGLDADANADPLTLYVSPGAIKHWNKYINDLGRNGLNVLQVVTEISFDPNQTYPSLMFNHADKEGDVRVPRLHSKLETMWALKQKAQDMLTREPDVEAANSD